MKKNYNLIRVVGVFSTIIILSGCTAGQIDRLAYVGKEPPMEKVQNPVERPEYAPISWPMPESRSAKVQTASSLWIDGSRAFFKDQRARNVGDILMVKVSIQDKAELANKTEVDRQSSDNLDLPGLFGLENKIFDALPGDVTSPTDILSVTGAKRNTGDGTIEREETIETEIAAVVTQVLPNGSLVISGTQEIRVNFEVRQLTIAGIIRPEDIGQANEVSLNQIAEARVSYGGRGLITDIQQPRVGHQIVDILSPF